jgi:hypothetical protein
MSKQIALIGWGAANMLFAAFLVKKAGVDARRLTIIDPFHDGGALIRQWANVKSNTTFQQFADATAALGLHVKAPDAVESHQHQHQHQPTPLKDIAHLLIAAVRPLVAGAKRIFGHATELKQAADGGWQISVQGDRSYNLQAAICSLAHGAQPRIMQTGVPQIPLAAALHLPTLQNYLSPGSSTVLFGSAHSAVLIADNILATGATCTMVHLGPQPFFFASEGAYDGVKQDAEVIARNILAGSHPVRLVQYEHALDVHAALLTADYAICACGFNSAAGAPSVVLQDGTVLSGLPYNPATGEIAPRLFGWGIAFPSKTTLDGRTYADVSIPSFTAHILAQSERLQGIL